MYLYIGAKLWDYLNQKRFQGRSAGELWNGVEKLEKRELYSAVYGEITDETGTYFVDRGITVAEAG